SRINSTAAMWSKLDIAVFSTGVPAETKLKHFTIMDQASAEMRKELAGLGVVGDVVGYLFTRDGKFLDHAWSKRLLSISLDELEKVPEKIAVVSGQQKVPSIIGMARTGIVNTIITNVATARAVLHELTM